MTARAKVAAVFLTGALTVGAPAAVLAHHGGMHVGRYRQVTGPAFFPDRVVIRCEGWAEDSARLRLVEYSADRVVYRCVTP